MNKMKEYERGREDGLDLALRIVRDGGIEALEREVKFRGITYLFSQQGPGQGSSENKRNDT